jgi:hemolysin type calcium-binding protein
MPSSLLRRRVLLLGVGAAMLLGAGHASANYTAALNGTTLEVTGDDRSDQLALRLDATGTMLVVDVKNDGTADFTFDRSLFDAISVSAGGGDDMVLIDETSGAFTEKSITVDGGPGRDTLIGGSGDDTLIGGDDDDFVDGRRGNDTVLLGVGDDVAVWDPGNGSDTIEGQDGDDRLEFHGANVNEHLDLSANGNRVRLTRDVASIVMDLNGVEEVDLSVRGGTDVVTVNDLTGTDLVRANVDLEGTPGSGVGDGQADTIVLPGTPGADVVTVSGTDGAVEADGLFTTVRAVHGDATLDTIEFLALAADEVHVNGTNKPDTITIVPSAIVGAMRALVDSFPTGVDVSGGGTLMVFGLGGPDTITGSNGLAALPTALVIDGGPGDDVITGGDGADVLMGGPGSDTVISGRGNDLVLLGTGSDTAVWRPGDGNDTIEGQEGVNDTLDFQGANVNERIEISPNGNRVRLTRDIANIVMDLNGVEQIGISVRGGTDLVVVDDLAGTDVKGVTVDLEGTPGSGTGDGQVDSVVVNGTPAKERMRLRVDRHGVVSLRRKGGAVRIEQPEPTDSLVVNGLGGGDKIHAAPTVSSAMTLTINPN